MNWIKKILGINTIIEKQDKVIDLLEEIAKQTKRNADLQQKYNEHYHIR